METKNVFYVVDFDPTTFERECFFNLFMEVSQIEGSSCPQQIEEGDQIEKLGIPFREPDFSINFLNSHF